ncbi:hypothetical protein RQM65_15235 [Pricia sp. S334]|uniref:DUF4179 domain-containing protein n=1 Tax=Pricia mediterranea TaxID=3076079 RepID=A0ABU3L8F0_9FLAO|nr:hypothetical protein [Pricia sp. S334]MDT7830020.1 hypothetical protein [Pricia sp. S334]
MKKETIEELFDRLQGDFDTEVPAGGHKQRFIEKLNASKGIMTPEKTKSSWSWWKPLAVAASIALLCTLGVGLFKSQRTIDQQVAQISPEVGRASYYFAGLIEAQIETLESESSPQTRQIIDDTMGQLDKLETDYARLEQDLVNGGNSKLILSAMITNFRTRIDLLQEVLDTIENIKNLNAYDDTEIVI